MRPGIALATAAGGRAIRIAALVITAATLAAAPVQEVHADPSFSPSATETCVATETAASRSLSGYAVLDCVGRAAQICMSSPGGDNTVGMIACLQAELAYWDRRLNAAYARRLAAAKAGDAETKIRGAALPIEESLRKMQRSWISYRDAACLYEQAQWQGGSGGGPAAAACHMNVTAQQAFRLEGWWSQ